MGSPKAAKSKASQGGIWRRSIGAPFVIVLAAAVLVLVVFTGQFAQEPDASSRFTPVHVEDSIPRRVPTDQGLETTDSSRQEGEGNDQKAEPDESPDEAIREQQQPPEDTTEYSGKESAAQVQEDEEGIVKEARNAEIHPQ